MGAQQSSPTLVVAILLPSNPPDALRRALPKSDSRAKIVIVDAEADISTIDVSQFTAILWVPPTPVARLTSLFDRVANQLHWVHCLSAGVDYLGEFITSRLASSPIPLTNGRGAFSSSLAEYVLAACLHHNKQFSRCERNRTEKQWDKFTMGTMKGKTMGTSTEPPTHGTPLGHAACICCHPAIAILTCAR